MAQPVSLFLDGDVIDARAGDTVAAALLRAGVTTFTRSIKYHRPRGPFCFDGSCGQCLIRVDGEMSLQACRTVVRPGMQCERQNAPMGLIDTDLFRAVDFLFPKKLDHHHLAVFSRTAGQVALEVARRLAGLGRLPDEPQAPRRAQMQSSRVVVVGAGPAGLAAAQAAATGGEPVLLVERMPEPGGAANLQVDPGSPAPEALAAQASALPGNVEVWLGSEAVGLYDDPAGLPLLAVRRSHGLTAVRAEKVVVATGRASQPLAFPGGDRPGVYAARGLIRLAQRHGLLVGKGPAPSLAVVGEGSELQRCCARLERAGYRIAASAEADRAVRARGNPVAELQLQREGGRVEKVRCDAVAVAMPPSALHELASSVGAEVDWDGALGAFRIRCDEAGRTSVPWLYACGGAAGQAGAGAQASGRAAGEGAARG